MKISTLCVKNYRTLEDIELDFSSSYSAICGKNDSGKTNTIRVLQILFGHHNRSPFSSDSSDVNLKTDYTKWHKVGNDNREIEIHATIEIDRIKDAGLFEFISTYLSLETEDPVLEVIVRLRYSDKQPEKIEIEINGQTYSALKAEEIVKKLRSSRCFLLHNSTEPEYPFRYRRMNALSRDFSPEYAELMDSVKSTIDTKVTKIAEAQQQEISQLLGRLQEKYSVRLALPEFNPGSMPVNITLGDKKHDIPLDDWGSGTRNRTRILLTLFRAKQVGESETSAEKVTPIIVIEEPESFLHPSAQAEFGRVLQDLSQEFDVQVIVTTHSPYMLSLARPDSNILLEREIDNVSLRSTFRVDISDENWMQPFGLALGIDSSEFSPWKTLFFTTDTSILLVEGILDKEYLELLVDEQHGENRLQFDGEMFPYGGSGTLKNTVLLRFIKNRYHRLFITYDLDVESQVEGTLKSLGFVKGQDYIGVGIPEPGKARIEGLLPASIQQDVYAQHPDLVNRLMDGKKKQRESARSELKKLLLEEFKKKAIPGDTEYYSQFYPLVRVLNKALCDSS